MAKKSDLAEAARLLSQAANSLINQSSQPATSRSTESSAAAIQMGTNNTASRARDEFRRLFSPYPQSNSSISLSAASVNGNISQRRPATNSNKSAKAQKRRAVKEI